MSKTLFIISFLILSLLYSVSPNVVNDPDYLWTMDTPEEIKEYGDGVIYIGEGGWGTHMGVPDQLWFAADKGSDHHFWFLNMDEGWNTLTGWPVKWINGAAVQGETFIIEQ